MSRLSTKQRRAARRRNAVLRPLERAAAIRRKYRNLSRVDAEREWSRFVDSFLRPITLLALDVLRRRGILP